MFDVYDEKRGEIVLIHLSGELSAFFISKFTDTWKVAVSGRPRIIALDCCNLKYADSTAISILFKYYNETLQKDIKLLLYGLQTPVQDIFSMTRLSKILTIISKEEFESDYLNAQ
jgi:anti-anti-sigma factor